MRSEAVKDFIRRSGYLFWYTPGDKGETVTDELLVETVLNYGSMDEVRELFAVMGIRNAAAVFWGMTGRKKLNYFPEIHHYFDLYFKKYAS
jgi:hypothetical protein